MGGIVVPAIAAPGADTDEVWIDYVSDVGDGFDATATVAWMLAQEQLVVDGGTPLPRGSVLVLGGDQVYPFASLEEYENRMLGPYRAMLPHTDAPHPLMLAIPGNHDWYDGLTAFMRVFAQARPEPTAAAHARGLDDAEPGAPAPTAGRWIGGWLTAQRRSYFAVQVRPGWWLWGLDIQLDTYIDAAADGVLQRRGPAPAAGRRRDPVLRPTELAALRARRSRELLGARLLRADVHPADGRQPPPDPHRRPPLLRPVRRGRRRAEDHRRRWGCLPRLGPPLPAHAGPPPERVPRPGQDGPAAVPARPDEPVPVGRGLPSRGRAGSGACCGATGRSCR